MKIKSKGFLVYEGLVDTLESVGDGFKCEPVFVARSRFDEFHLSRYVSSILDVDGIEFMSLSLEGELRSDFLEWDVYKDILRRSGADFGKDGRIALQIEFEEMKSRQGLDAAGMVFVSIEKGNGYFTYVSGSSDMSTDLEYAKEVFVKMFRELGLPMELIDSDCGYKFCHTQGGYLWTTGGWGWINPCGFTCQIDSEGRAETLIKMLKVFCDGFVRNRVFRVSWSAGHSAFNDGMYVAHSLLMSIYKRVIEGGNPYHRLIVNAGYRIYNVEGLRAIQALCEGRRAAVVPFFVVHVGGVKVNLGVYMSENGFCIQLASKDEAALQQVVSRLEERGQVFSE